MDEKYTCMGAGGIVISNTSGVEFSAHSARLETGVEAVILAGLLRAGL